MEEGCPREQSVEIFPGQIPIRSPVRKHRPLAVGGDEHDDRARGHSGVDGDPGVDTEPLECPRVPGGVGRPRAGGESDPGAEGGQPGGLVGGRAAAGELDLRRCVSGDIDGCLRPDDHIVHDVADDDDGAMCVSGMCAAEIGELAASVGVTLHELSPQMASLEDAFMELTRDSVEFHVHDDADGDDQSPASRAGDRLAPVER